MELVFDKATNQYNLRKPETTPATMEQSDSADMEQSGVLHGINNLQIAGIPIGAGAIGGTLAFTLDALFDRFFPQVTGSMANLLAAFVINTSFATKFLGKDAAKFAGMFLVYEAIRNPIEEAVRPVISGSSQQPHSQNRQMQSQQMKQTPPVTSGFYDFALRRI